MKENFNTQVSPGYYNMASYNTLERFISYYYQIDSILKLEEIKTVLEIGAGNSVVSRYLINCGINVTTCDFDKNTFPDIISDVRNIQSKDKSYDIAVAFQVLEHIPFGFFEEALTEMARVSKKYIIISLPYRSTYFEFVFKFPLIRTFLKKNFLDLSLRWPLKFAGFETSGQHYWEIDKNKYSLKKVKDIIKKHFIIKNEFSPVLNKFHYFFILEIK